MPISIKKAPPSPTQVGYLTGALLHDKQFLLESRIKYETVRAYCVYFLFKGEELVYVGKSCDGPFGRLNSHQKDKEFDSYSVVYFKTEEEMDVMETEYIAYFKPVLNKTSVVIHKLGLIGQGAIKSMGYPWYYVKKAITAGAIPIVFNDLKHGLVVKIEDVIAEFGEPKNWWHDPRHQFPSALKSAIDQAINSGKISRHGPWVYQKVTSGTYKVWQKEEA